MHKGGRGGAGVMTVPGLALLVGKKRCEFSSDVQRRQTGQRKGFLKVRSKSNRKHSLLTMWSKMSVEAASGISPGEKGVANKPLSAHNVTPPPHICCQLLTMALVGEESDKHGGKQVEVRGRNRQRDAIMY